MNDAIQTGDRLADLDIDAIKRMIPHRYPFLMIDRVVEIEAETSAVGIKNVTVNEPHFAGPFPRPADHAGGADHRGHGADRGGAGGGQHRAGRGGQARCTS